MPKLGERGKRTPIEVRFWRNVQKCEGDGCWNWVGRTKTRKGYGRIFTHWRRSPITTHRVSWILHYGPIPDGLWVLHKCDNPPCVRPDHLYLGTVVDNVRDAVERGRIVVPKDQVGEKHPRAKLTDSDVLRIRELYAARTKQIDIARMYGLNQASVSDIISGQSWSHLPEGRTNKLQRDRDEATLLHDLLAAGWKLAVAARHLGIPSTTARRLIDRFAPAVDLLPDPEIRA